MARRVVASGALHLNSKERLTDHMRLRGHRNIVLRRHPEPGWTALQLPALHHDEFGDEPVKRLILQERLVDEPTKRAGVVQRWIDDVWVLSQDILPIADPVIRPSFVCQQTLNHLRATCGGGVGQIGGDLLASWNGSNRVQRDAAEKREVTQMLRRVDVRCRELHINEIVNRPRPIVPWQDEFGTNRVSKVPVFNLACARCITPLFVDRD